MNTQEINEGAAADMQKQIDVLRSQLDREIRKSAKMRKSLVYCRDALENILKTHQGLPDSAERRMRELVAISSLSIAAPATNFEKYPDASSAWQAWLQDAGNWDDFGSPRKEFPEWLYAKAVDKRRQ